MPARKLSNLPDAGDSEDAADNFVFEDLATALNGLKSGPKFTVIVRLHLVDCELTDDEGAASFAFEGEDHTLGNALRWIIMKNPAVELCGYSIPHPAEDKMHLRIQTEEGYDAVDALEKGLEDLMELCDVVLEKFEAAREEFDQNQEAQSRE